MTPFGEADESCVYEISNGARVDAQTGDVELNGSIIDHIAPCASGLKSENSMSKRTDGGALPSSGGWYSHTDAQWPSIGGASYPFDDFYFEVSPPTGPTPPAGDNPLLYYFGSLQNNQGLANNGLGCGSNIFLLQPVLQWGSNGVTGSGPFWTIASWILFGCNADCVTNCKVGHGPYHTVSPGDPLNGSVVQVASNLDQWDVEFYDGNSGVSSNEALYDIPNEWPKAGSLQGAVFEGHYLNSCQDLPPGNSIVFNNGGIYVGYPSWNDEDEVSIYGSNLLSWSGWHAPSLTPICNANASVDTTSTDNSTLTWKE